MCIRDSAHREDLERERTDDEFMAMYEQYEAFDELEEEFLEKEEGITAFLCSAGSLPEQIARLLQLLFGKLLFLHPSKRWCEP